MKFSGRKSSRPLSRSAHQTTNFTKSEFQFPRFKVLQSVLVRSLFKVSFFIFSKRPYGKMSELKFCECSQLAKSSLWWKFHFDFYFLWVEMFTDQFTANFLVRISCLIRRLTKRWNSRRTWKICYVFNFQLIKNQIENNTNRSYWALELYFFWVKAP